jgi:predicted AlkP superfamily phosphohydrolase/phosphomutase
VAGVGVKKAAVIGLDGAAWHLLDPILRNGHMPRLAALKNGGASGTLASTVPTYTPPAWTSAATGVNPGRHGIYGFVDGHAQTQAGLVHPGKIKASTIWEIANAQGVRAGIYNLPLTYPPRPIDGWMVSGMLTPSYGERQRGFTSPPHLEEKILEWVPDYVLDTSAHYERDWRDPTLSKRTLEVLRQRLRVLEGLLELDPPGIVFSVLEAPDRLQHVYYRYLDPADDLYDSEEAGKIRPHVLRCFEAMDDIVGLLTDYVADDGGVVVCSDHGFTTWEVSVHVNALLERWGYLKVKTGARAMQTGLARRLAGTAKLLLPPRLARRAKGRTFAAIDWSRTKAFASPIPQQGIYLNIKGREPYGIVEPSRVEALKDEIADRFDSLRGPDGSAVTDRVWRSDEVFTGDARDGAPDLLPVLKDHRFELDDEVFHRQPFTDVSDMPRGVHHPDGVVVVAGPGVKAGVTAKGSVMDVTPTLLYLAGLKIPEGLDGSPLTDAFDSDWLRRRPVETTAEPAVAARDEESPYTDEEEAVIEESLRGLGYL